MISSQYKDQLNELESWMASPRFNSIYRPYNAEQVFAARNSPSVPSLNVSFANTQAKKLYKLLRQHQKNGTPCHTLGAIDPIQMTQYARHLEVCYVSGWAASSTLTPTNDVGPDLADYPYETVPNCVDRLTRAQLLHDKKSWAEHCKTGGKSEFVDYLRPVIADADTGHGGLSTVMKQAKLFVEAGVSGIHIEDQLHGGKKCGHQGGKIVVPTGEEVARLIAARLQFDLMGTETVLIARTDSESSKLISSSVDGRDQEFILGVTDTQVIPLAEHIAAAERSRSGAAVIDAAEKEWTSKNKLVTFSQAAAEQLAADGLTQAEIDKAVKALSGLSNYEARQHIREQFGKEVSWNSDVARTREGFYNFNGGIDAAVKRAIEFAPYADMLWLETKTPDLAYAREFAQRIKKVQPDKMLVYNLSPSFNWSAQGFTDEKLKSFIWDMAKEGFVLQLVSLAGLHSAGLIAHQLATAYKTDGMLAYTNLIQKVEKESGADMLKHQKWSGAELVDDLLSIVQAGNSGSKAMGGDSTENQFS
jgi:isocitrate lyase